MRQSVHRLRLRHLAILMAAIALVGVGVWYSTRDVADADLAHISCRLKWHHQAQFAGAYMADTKGLFRQNGLDCTLRPGGQDFNALRLVVSGSDDFGIWGADSVLLGRSQGMPVVAVAVIFQKSPVCFFARRDSGITEPKDFVGKTVGMQYGTNVRIEYLAMMHNAGVSPESVNETPSKFDLQRFLTGDVDVWNGYTINEPRVAERKGVPVTLIRPADYGVDMYADCVITTERMIRERPEVVRGFVHALVRGWEYALSHPEEAVEATLAVDGTLDRTHQTDMLAACAELVRARSAAVAGIGHMDREVWRKMYAELNRQGLLGPRPVDIDAAFTNEFFPGEGDPRHE